MTEKIPAFAVAVSPLEKARRTLAQSRLIGNRRLGCALDIRVNGKSGFGRRFMRDFSGFNAQAAAISRRFRD
jgi:hypothetical protein